jgi:hypothetical protein
VDSSAEYPTSEFPWLWRPAANSWYQGLHTAIERWRPSECLQVDQNYCINTLSSAASAKKRWLWHPCINALLSSDRNNKVTRDLLILAWISANHDSFDHSVTVTDTSWIWSTAGGMKVSPGTYTLRELSGKKHAPWPWGITPDPWCRSVGFVLDQSWAEYPVSIQSQQHLETELRLLMRTLAIAEQTQPAWYEWLAAVTQVVVPLRTRTENTADARHINSSSSRQLPGLVQLTVHDPVQVLEALVHESAHQHMFFVEADGPVVDPAHQALYPSPLRKDLRPLRGILAAYHALAYICAFYTDAERQYLVDAESCNRHLQSFHPLLLSAERTLISAQSALTDRGKTFFNLTMGVAAYGH